jgi:hypothetical protein
VVLTTRDAGATWVPAAVPAGALAMSGVQCTGTADCVAIVSDGTDDWSARSADFGHTWQQEGNLPAGFQGARDVSCLVGGSCLVAGYTATTTGHGQGAVAISPDGGQTWQAANLPAGQGELQNATCSTVTICLAVGSTSTTVSDVVPAKGTLLDSVDGGHTWVPSVSAPPVDDIYGIACPVTRVCAVVGTRWVGHPAVGTGAVAHSSDGGVSFTPSTAAYVPLTLTALSCPSALTCLAVGGDITARIALPALRAAAKRSNPDTHHSPS